MPGDAVAGTCDCHVHVVGPTDRFPQSATRAYTADLATLDSLLAMAKPFGVGRFVVVQASFYRTDNTCLLECLEQLGEKGRGVVAVDFDGAAPDLLKQYARRGVCGLRLNLYSKSLIPTSGRLQDLVGATTEIAAANRWHVEIIAPMSAVLRAAAEIADSHAPVVLDHYGLPGEALPESREGRSLLDLVALPHVWVKLTAPYRVAADPLATRPPASWLAALLRTAPERCVWGSDWPHTPLDHDQKGPDATAPYRKIRYGRLLEDFLRALPDPALAAQVLADNPRRLYGFAAS